MVGLNVEPKASQQAITLTVTDIINSSAGILKYPRAIMSNAARKKHSDARELSFKQ
jgi:hypothetical protein